jgi:hypothetical protein
VPRVPIPIRNGAAGRVAVNAPGLAVVRGVAIVVVGGQGEILSADPADLVGSAGLVDAVSGLAGSGLVGHHPPTFTVTMVFLMFPP